VTPESWEKTEDYELMEMCDVEWGTMKECKSCQRVYQGEQEIFALGSRFRMDSMGLLWFNCACGSTLLVKARELEIEQQQLESLAFKAFRKVLSSPAMKLTEQIPVFEKLPKVSSRYSRIQQQLLENPLYEPDRISLLIKQEPFLMHEVITAANLRSQAAGRTMINNLVHALAFIGKKELDQLIALAWMKAIDLPTKRFDLGLYSLNACLTGFIAEFVNLRLHLVQDTDVYYYASFLNIGKLVQALVYPDVTDSFIDALRIEPISWSQAESRAGIPDHNKLGEIAASFWGMEERHVQLIAAHHTLAPSEGRLAEALYLCQLAIIIKHWVMLEPAKIDKTMQNSLLIKLQLTESSLERDIVEPLFREAQVLKLRAEIEAARTGKAS
jgi:HD-like signal output (HDOD) protein